VNGVVSRVIQQSSWWVSRFVRHFVPSEWHGL